MHFFKLNKLLINEAEDTIEAGVDEESIIWTREKISLIYTFQIVCHGASFNNGRGQVYLNFFHQRKQFGVIITSSNNGRGWVYFDFFPQRNQSVEL